MPLSRAALKASCFGCCCAVQALTTPLKRTATPLGSSWQRVPTLCCAFHSNAFLWAGWRAAPTGPRHAIPLDTPRQQAAAPMHTRAYPENAAALPLAVCQKRQRPCQTWHSRCGGCHSRLSASTVPACEVVKHGPKRRFSVFPRLPSYLFFTAALLEPLLYNTLGI